MNIMGAMISTIYNTSDRVVLMRTFVFFNNLK
jgi:hypothetical protein